MIVKLKNKQEFTVSEYCGVKALQVIDDKLILTGIDEIIGDYFTISIDSNKYTSFIVSKGE